MKNIYGYKERGLWWFRVFGWGLHGKDITKNRLLFSERYGYSKSLRIKNWSFKILKPFRP